MTVGIWDADGVWRQGYLIEGNWYSKQQLWAWLKAENHYSPPKEQTSVVPNRRARRRMSKNWQRIAA